MSSIIVAGDTSGSVTLQAPAVAGSTVLTLPAVSGTVITNTAGVVTQAMLATNVAGNGPAFSAYPSALTTISSSTNTVIVLDTEVFDTNGCFNNTGSTVTLNGVSTPAYSFAPNVAGYYLFAATINDESSTAASRFFFTINRNGGDAASVRVSDVALSTVTGVSGSCIIYLNGTTDYVSLSVYIVATTAKYTAGPNVTRFSASMVRSA